MKRLIVAALAVAALSGTGAFAQDAKKTRKSSRCEVAVRRESPAANRVGSPLARLEHSTRG